MHSAYRLAYLYTLVRDGLISESEAFAQVRADTGLLASTELGVAADAVWEVARTNRNHGVVLASLLHEWASVHAPQSLKTTAMTLVRAATEVLTVTDDAWLYQRASQAADVLANNGSALDHYYAGMLHLSAYALDPCNIEYSFNRQFRRDRMCRAQLPAGEPDVVMPKPDVALRRATHHLAETASRTSGQGRGLALAQLAFAEYSRHKAGEEADLPAVDAWCAEAARLLAVDSAPLACNRLFWLLCLRETYDPAYRRQVLIPRTDLMPDGLVSDVLAGSTAVRLLIYGDQRAAAGPVIEKVLPLLDDDPELEAHRRFLELGVVHCLPGDSSTCAQIERGWTPAPADGAGLLHTLAHTGDDANDELVATAVRSSTPHLSRVVHRLLAHRKVIRARLELSDKLFHALKPVAAATKELISPGTRCGRRTGSAT